MRGLDIPSLTLRNKEHARYAGIRFGSGKSDIAYLVFDCKEKYSHYDRLYVYASGHSRYGKPTLFRGKKRNNSYSFSGVKLSADWGGKRLDCKLIICPRMLWDDNKMYIYIASECRLSDKKVLKKCTFDLTGKNKSQQNDAQYIEAVPVLQKPSLKGRWDRRSEQPHIRGRVMMGKLNMEPGQYMNSRAKVAITIRGDTKPWQSNRFRMKPSGARSEFKYYSDKRFRKETEYDMHLSVDLALFMGTVSVKDNMVLR